MEINLSSLKKNHLGFVSKREQSSFDMLFQELYSFSFCLSRRYMFMLKESLAILYFQKKIDNLTKQKTELCQYLTEELDLFGMSQTQKKLYQKIINKNTNIILGKEMHANEKSIFNDISNVLQVEVNKTRQFWKQHLTDLDKLSQRINTFKNIYKRRNEYMLQDSKIISTLKQQTYLNANFQNIKNMKLLYRVQKTNFKLQEFKLKCKNAENTLILIQTSNKKIGCFTDINLKLIQASIKNSSKICLISFTDQQRSTQRIIQNINKLSLSFRNSNNTLQIKQSSIFCDFKAFENQPDFLCGQKQQPIIELQVWEIFFE